MRSPPLQYRRKKVQEYIIRRILYTIMTIFAVATILFFIFRVMPGDPTAQVISPALFGEKDGLGPVIDEINCTNCARCIDVCSKQVFNFGTRFNNTLTLNMEHEEATT